MFDWVFAGAAAYQPILGLGFITALFVAFASERFPPVTIAVVGAGAMIVFSRLAPSLVTAAFPSAPITIAAFFVLSGAPIRTGTVEALARIVVRRAGDQQRGRSDHAPGGDRTSASDRQRSARAYRRGHVCRIGQLRHANRLPDQYDGVCRGRLSFFRLREDRTADEHHGWVGDLGRHRLADPLRRVMTAPEQPIEWPVRR